MLEKTNSLVIQELKNCCDKKKKEFDGGEQALFLSSVFSAPLTLLEIWGST